MQAVTGQERKGDGQQAQDFQAAQGVFAEHFEHVRKERDAGAEENEADDVERAGVFFAVVREMPIDQVQAQKANGEIDEEDDAPVKIADNEAADQRTEHGANQTGDGDEGHGPDEFGFGKRSHHGQPAHRDHHGAAAALEDAASHQNMDVAGEAAENRAEREEADGGRKHPAGAESVRHPAADGNENGQTQGVTGEHRFHAQRHHSQGLGNGGDARVEDGGVERLHEEGHGDEPRQQPFGRRARQARIRRRSDGIGRVQVCGFTGWIGRDSPESPGCNGLACGAGEPARRRRRKATWLSGRGHAARKPAHGRFAGSRRGRRRA